MVVRLSDMEMRARKSAIAADRLGETDSVKRIDAVNGALEPAPATATSRSRPRVEQESNYEEPLLDTMKQERATLAKGKEKTRRINGKEEKARLANGPEKARFTDRSGIAGREGPAGGGTNGTALLCMALLALQYGLQPILTRKLLSRDVLISSQVITCEVLKVLIAITAMFLDGSLFSIWRHWHPLDSLQAAGVPGLLYAAQNTLIQMALRHLDYLTFNLLNQTKLLFTALSNYLFLRIRQTRLQLLALCLLLVAATLLTVGPGQPQSQGSSASERGEGAGMGGEWAGGDAQKAAAGVAWERVVLGVVPVLVASVTSGLGSTHNQWQVQVKRRNPHLFTIEMCTLTSLTLLFTLLSSQDGARMARLGFFHAWTPLTIIPALSNAIGGILVGLVTKYAGGVKKGFTVIAGLLVTAIVQYLLDGTPPSFFVWLALPLTILSTVLYSTSAAPASADRTRKKSL
ncbi:hypothetical protein CLOM_g3386 [Closterium sp. NIES-68]|nr:hypothetical protein CLOM_g3386 [Closterium sp. NIES-68]GJP76532.1 hypothetical protein CLOP_g6963 [Closterium sp. NIES-67]